MPPFHFVRECEKATVLYENKLKKYVAVKVSADLQPPQSDTRTLHTITHLIKVNHGCNDLNGARAEELILHTRPLSYSKFQSTKVPRATLIFQPSGGLYNCR